MDFLFFCYGNDMKSCRFTAYVNIRKEIRKIADNKIQKLKSFTANMIVLNPQEFEVMDYSTDVVVCLRSRKKVFDELN